MSGLAERRALAAKLIAAVRDRAVLAPQPAEIPASLAEAEAVQDAVVAGTIRKIGAWKLGATVKSVREGFGLERGFFGVLPAERVLPSGAEPPASDLPQAGVESEIAFRFGRDLDPRGAPWSASASTLSDRLLLVCSICARISDGLLVIGCPPRCPSMRSESC